MKSKSNDDHVDFSLDYSRAFDLVDISPVVCIPLRVWNFKIGEIS